MIKKVKSLEELRTVAEALLREVARLPSPDCSFVERSGSGGQAHAPLGEGATIIGLSGDLGAGKTAFVKCVASILGIRETITSPTFILEKVYIIPRGSLLGSRFAKLIHIDAYRLEGGTEMHALGWEAIASDPQNLIFIEWPEQVADALPRTMRTLAFTYVDETTRTITF